MSLIDVGWARQMARETMRDTCTITRGSTRGAFDPDTLTYATVAGTVVYQGRCRVDRGFAGSDVDAASLEALVARPVVVIPWDAAVIEPGDTVTVTETDDVQLVDRPLEVTGIPFSSVAVERKLLTEDTRIP